MNTRPSSTGWRRHPAGHCLLTVMAGLLLLSGAHLSAAGAGEPVIQVSAAEPVNQSGPAEDGAPALKSPTDLRVELLRREAGRTIAALAAKRGDDGPEREQDHARQIEQVKRDLEISILEVYLEEATEQGDATRMEDLLDQMEKLLKPVPRQPGPAPVVPGPNHPEAVSHHEEVQS
ncbi:hypothetical protein JW905_15545 [bacterium]|nr:hypothetical protein [candidate division CSSED10-310 bacterium]